MLSELLSPLDYPRQAAANLARGLGRAFSGEATTDDYLGMAPAAFGAAAGLAGLGPLGMAIAAGVGQGVGRMTGSQAFDAPTVGDNLEAIGGDRDSLLQNVGMQLATDPLTYVGMAGPLFYKNLPRRNVGGFGLPEAPAPTSPGGSAAVPLGEAQTVEALRAASDQRMAERLAALPQRPQPAVPDIGTAEQLSQRVGPRIPGIDLPVLKTRPEGLPPMGDPAAMEDALARMVGVAGDMEQDLRDPAFLRSVGAADALSQRANLWQQILAGSGEYKHAYGSFPQLGDEAANVIHASYGRNMGESALLELLQGAPTSPEVLGLAQQMAPMRKGGSLAYLRADLMRSPEMPSLSTLSDDLAMHGQAASKPLMDEAWSMLDKQTFRILRGAGSPQEASQLIDELVAMGWPIDRARASQMWWQSKLGNISVPTQYLPEHLANAQEWYRSGVLDHVSPGAAGQTIPGVPAWASVRADDLAKGTEYGYRAMASHIGDPLNDVYNVFGEPGVQSVMRRALNGNQHGIPYSNQNASDPTLLMQELYRGLVRLPIL